MGRFFHATIATHIFDNAFDKLPKLTPLDLKTYEQVWGPVADWEQGPSILSAIVNEMKTSHLLAVPTQEGSIYVTIPVNQDLVQSHLSPAHRIAFETLCAATTVHYHPLTAHVVELMNNQGYRVELLSLPLFNDMLRQMEQYQLVSGQLCLWQVFAYMCGLNPYDLPKSTQLKKETVS